MTLAGLHIEPDAGVALRPMSESDLSFLTALYASTREEELRPLAWSEVEKASFLAFQFACQHDHYQKHYPEAAFDVIERAGAPIGRLYLARIGDDLRIVDVALVPAERRRGIGTRLLRATIALAEHEGRSVSIHVERDNPARALYERLGFCLREDRGVYLFMVHAAGSVRTSGQDRSGPAATLEPHAAPTPD